MHRHFRTKNHIGSRLITYNIGSSLKNSGKQEGGGVGRLGGFK